MLHPEPQASPAAPPTILVWCNDTDLLPCPRTFALGVIPAQTPPSYPSGACWSSVTTILSLTSTFCHITLSYCLFHYCHHYLTSYHPLGCKLPRKELLVQLFNWVSPAQCPSQGRCYQRQGKWLSGGCRTYSLVEGGVPSQLCVRGCRRWDGALWDREKMWLRGRHIHK